MIHDLTDDIKDTLILTLNSSNFLQDFLSPTQRRPKSMLLKT